MMAVAVVLPVRSLRRDGACAELRQLAQGFPSTPGHGRRSDRHQSAASTVALVRTLGDRQRRQIHTNRTVHIRVIDRNVAFGFSPSVKVPGTNAQLLKVSKQRISRK